MMGWQTSLAKKGKSIMAIPRREFVGHNGIYGVTLGLLNRYHTRTEVTHFLEWMKGRTTAKLIGAGTTVYYSWDYEGWLQTITPQCE